MNQDRVTKLAEGTIVKGEVSFPGGKLRIEGELHGNVNSADSVEVVQNGRLLGDVLEANEIELLGKIEGNIKTKKLVVRPTGILTGNLEVEHFVMEEGGKILGEVKMNLGEVREAWKAVAGNKR
ncbi:polymer-forming cytoskeletal protein [bacterium]|jgi:cytoskeletal protein CcmA (bactofilin family)|nr:polymer-forming cytoskeletal protein [bacterium]MCI0604134.1 polymer-forming cytoskeletal protein [bacterium]